MPKSKKEYLSEPINVELEWIKDIRNKDIRSRMKALDLSISITYTYFVYHDYSVTQLAKINGTTEHQIVIWILIGAYTLNGLPCHRCVWADLRTGRVICFRNCKGFNCFQSK